jgi:phosphatidylglycerol:prolipoprotein diacylglycerol transferase
MTTVEFPGLRGLHFIINRVAFEVGGIPIYWYGIIISMAFLLAILLALRDSKKFGFEPDTIIDLALFVTPAAIICARLYYVAFSWDEFKDQPINILNTRTGGLAIYGGILGAIIVAYIFSRVRKINILSLLDFGIPYVALGQSIGRWGNFVNQEAFGTNTTLPWGMTSDVVKQELLRNMDKLGRQGITVDPNIPVHPTFLYESIWDISVFLLLIWYRKRKKLNGEVFFLYMVLYGAGRFFIEALRTDSLMIGNLRVSQVLAFVFVVVFGILLIVRRKKVVESAESVEIGASSYGAVLKKMQDGKNADVQDIDEDDAGMKTESNKEQE